MLTITEAPGASGCNADRAHPLSLPTPAATTPRPSINVLCVDDHEALTMGLNSRFELDGSIRMVGRLASADHLLDEIARLQPNLVILDIEMPGPDVFEIADRLHHRYPSLRFVFLSAHIKDGYLAAAYRCGASGYLAKADDLSCIVASLKEVAHSPRGTFVMGPKVKMRFAQQSVRFSPMPRRSTTVDSTHDPRHSPRLGCLTGREIEVLRLIGKGLSRHQIAAELSRSAKTIDGHQEHIMNKLQIQTRADLIRFAIREGLAEA